MTEYTSYWLHDLVYITWVI